MLTNSGKPSIADNWRVACFSSTVTVAIPIWQERVSPVLDAATRLLVVTRQRGLARDGAKCFSIRWRRRPSREVSRSCA